MEGHVGLDVEKSRSGNITVVGLTSGMAADVSSMVWEGDVLEAGDLSDHAGGARSCFVENQHDYAFYSHSCQPHSSQLMAYLCMTCRP